MNKERDSTAYKSEVSNTENPFNYNQNDEDDLLSKVKLKLRANNIKNKRLTKINEIDEISNYD